MSKQITISQQDKIKLVKGIVDFIRYCVYTVINKHCGGKQMLDYISVQQASENWGIFKRRIQNFCEENRINGAVRFGRAWAIPKDAEKPVEARRRRNDGK